MCQSVLWTSESDLFQAYEYHIYQLCIDSKQQI